MSAAARQAAHHIGDDDLPTGRGCAEPRRLDHRRAEDVAALVRRLSGRGTDADVERIAVGSGRSAVGRLLHGDGAGDGARALSKRSISPSPVVFTSVPPCFATAPRSAVKCSWRSASYAS